MLSLKEIQTRTFDKAVFGGYDMKAVDEFLEEVTETCVNIQSENDTLKGKMKVLISKVEEYKTVEESMRKALLSAQNIADEMIEKANEKSKIIMETANKESTIRAEILRQEIEIEEAKLEKAREKTQKLTTKITEYYTSEIESIKRLAEGIDLKAIKEAKEVTEPTKPKAKKQKAIEETIELDESNKKTLDFEDVPEMPIEKFDISNSSNIEELLKMSKGLETKLIEVSIPLDAKKSKNREQLFKTAELQFGDDYIDEK